MSILTDSKFVIYQCHKLEVFSFISLFQCASGEHIKGVAGFSFAESSADRSAFQPEAQPASASLRLYFKHPGPSFHFCVID